METGLVSQVALQEGKQELGAEGNAHLSARAGKGLDRIQSSTSTGVETD